MAAVSAMGSISDEKLAVLRAVGSYCGGVVCNAVEWRGLLHRLRAAEDALETIDCHLTIDCKPEVRAAIDKWRASRKGGRVEGEEG